MALFDVGLVNGKDGKSAYQYAKDAGYKGTESEFAETLADIGVTLTSTLPAGQTTLTFIDEKITADSILNTVYTSIFGVSVKSAEFIDGSLTIEFVEQDEDMEVVAIIDASATAIDDAAQSQMHEHFKAIDPHNIEDGLINKEVAEEVATDDKVLVVVDGQILKTNVDNIGVREIEGSATLTTTTVLTDEWQAMSGLDTSKVYRGVAYGDGKYVCIGDGSLSYFSTDGLSWTAQSIPNMSSSYSLYGVTYGDGRFVCVGNNGYSYYSTDGQIWTAMRGLDTNKAYWGVTYGNGRFICVGHTVSYYSTDGETWQAMTGLDTNYSHMDATYGDGRFVCVSTYGLSYYSTDGETWQAMTGLDTSKNYRGVAYYDGRFVCVGDNGVSAYSTDGETWQAMTGLDTSIANYEDVAYGNGRFVCVGKGGASYYSTDGETWQAISGLVTSKHYIAVTYGTEFVCVGESGLSSHHVYDVETNTETLQSTLQVAGTLLLTKLYTGQTTVTITDEAITQDCTIDIYTDKYGVNPKNVTVDTGSITLEFKAQETDVNIKVVVK